MGFCVWITTAPISFNPNSAPGSFFQGVYVDAVADGIHRRADRLRCMFEQISVADLKLPLVHPHQTRIQAAHHMRLMRRRNQHIAAADIDFVFQAKRDGHRRESATKLSLVGHDRLHTAGAAARQNCDWVTRFDDPGSNLAGIAAEVQVRPHNILHGKTEFCKVAVACDVHRLEVMEQARAFKPRHVPLFATTLSPLRALIGMK